MGESRRRIRRTVDGPARLRAAEIRIASLEARLRTSEAEAEHAQHLRREVERLVALLFHRADIEAGNDLEAGSDPAESSSEVRP